jgi:apolipoprotein N-acyltransferase
MTRADPETRRRLTLAGLAVLSGALYFLGFAGFNQWVLAFLAYVPFAEMLRRAPTGRSAFGFGLLMGLTTHLGGYYWIPTTLSHFGGFPYPISLAMNVVLCSWGGLSFALLAWGLKRWWMAGGRPFPSLAVGVVFVEWAYPLLFPSYLANSFWQVPLMIQICDLGGTLLLSAVVVLVSTALYLALRWVLEGRTGRFPVLPAAVAAGALAATLLYGWVRIDQLDAAAAGEPPLRVGVVQVNMGMFEKHEKVREGILRHVEDSLPLQDAGVDLLIWPESAYNGILRAVPGEPVGEHLGKLDLPHPLGEILPGAPPAAGGAPRREIHTPVLLGAVRRQVGSDRSRHFNSAFLIDGGGTVLGTYDKTHLLAFGEYLPFGETFPWLYDLSPHSGRWTPGSRLDSLPLGPWRIGPLICYEDVLPGFVRSLVRKSDPHLLVNITNDAWFGDTTEPEIHLALSVFRSVEHRRWMVRATNSGISAVIDPVGRVVARTGQMSRETLSHTVRWRRAVTLYGVLGDWPGWIALGLCAWAFWRMWKNGHLRLRRERDGRPGRKVKRAAR